MRGRPRWLTLAVYAAACATWPSSAAGAPAAGTLDDPIPLLDNPFAVRGSTSGKSSVIASYACDESIDESGGEVVYRFDAPHAGKLSAYIDGDGAGVDIDVHILSGLDIAGNTASECIERANVIAEAGVSAGPVYIVVDSFGGSAQEGEFVLRVTLIGDAWTEFEPFEGVVWRARRFADLAGGLQVVHELRVDMANPALTVESLQSNGCQTLSAMATSAGAVAAINGGYFGAGCDPVSLLIHDSEVLGLNGSTRSAFGFDSAGLPMIELIAAQQPWPEAVEAQGGGPRLLSGGVPNTSNDAYADESVVDPGFIGPNPRSAAGIAPDGTVSFWTIDGRGPAAGMSLPALANFSLDELGLEDAMNLDGGGSSTTYVATMTPNGVVNYPSDSAVNEPDDHTGSRSVSGGFFVFSVPKNHAPVFTTTPPTAVDLDSSLVYDADAYDVDPLDVLGYSVEGAPQGMSIDGASGELTFDPPAEYPAHVSFTLRVASGDASATQTLDLDIPGGVETTTAVGSGGGGAGAATGGAGASAGEDNDEEGCSCRTSSSNRAVSGQLALLALAAAASARLLVAARRA